MNIILLSRRHKQQQWDTIINPSLSDIESATNFLVNDYNEYVEVKNCGITYRYVRKRDLHKYNLGG